MTEQPQTKSNSHTTSTRRIDADVTSSRHIDIGTTRFQLRVPAGIYSERKLKVIHRKPNIMAKSKESWFFKKSYFPFSRDSFLSRFSYQNENQWQCAKKGNNENSAANFFSSSPPAILVESTAKDCRLGKKRKTTKHLHMQLRIQLYEIRFLRDLTVSEHVRKRKIFITRLRNFLRANLSNNTSNENQACKVNLTRENLLVRVYWLCEGVPQEPKKYIWSQ